MKRVNLEKTVSQLYLKERRTKNEINRKALLYEQTCKSNKENRKLVTPTPLDHAENVNAFLKPHCNRSAVYMSAKGTNFCDITADSSILLKMKQESKRKILKFRKYIENDKRIESMLSIDKL